MKFIYLFNFFILFNLSNIFAQTLPVYSSASEKSYARYFNRNKQKIDPIEGIWVEHAVGSLYENRRLIKRELEPNRAKWIVVRKKNKNEFEVLSINGKKNLFDASFKKVSKNNSYLFKCTIKELGDSITSSVNLYNNQINMEYNAPNGIFSQKYEKKIDKDIVLHWKIEWVKLSPVYVGKSIK